MNDPKLRTIFSSTNAVAGENLEEIIKHGDIEYPLGIYLTTLKEGYHDHIRWHWHDEIELIIVKNGSGDVYVGDDVFRLTKGEALFINTGKLQSARIVDDAPEGFVYYSIIFHPTIVLSYGLTRLCSAYLNPILYNDSFNAYKITGNHSLGEEVLAYLYDVIDVNKKQSLAYELITKEHLIHLWVLMLHFGAVSSISPSKSALTRFSLDEARSKEAVRFIEDHYNEQITLTDIADSIHVSKNECCRCIKRYMRMTPFEYLLSYRIYRSSVLLLDKQNTDSIADIAIKVGFNNTSYFNKVFKKHMDCTPKEYRARGPKVGSTVY